MPSSIRPAFAALWQLDLAFADVVSTSTDPRLGAIRLAWWRERLEGLDEGAEPPAEPRLQAVVRDLLPRGVSGRELSLLEDAWLPMLEPFPWGMEQVEGFKARGRLLFDAAARLIGGDPGAASGAGELWSLVDGAFHCSDADSRTRLEEAARAALPWLPRSVPAVLRPLTMLAALAAYDVAPRGRLGRGGAALKHRLTGRFP